MKKLKLKIANHIAKRKSKFKFTPLIFISSLAIVAASSYYLGVRHFDVEAALGPIFGYRAHNGTLDLSSVQAAYNALAANYDGKLDEQALINGAKHGLVQAAGDNYTVYLNPSEANTFNKDYSGYIGGGIGAEIGLKNNKVTIIRTLPDNPARAAGLQANDVVTSVNDQSVVGWTVEQAVTQIRGEVGTTVKLTIQRGSEVKDYTITRAIINNPSVQGEIKNDVGVLTIKRFDDQTGSLAQKEAAKFASAKVKGIVLDLRGNAGGGVDAAVEVASLWLNNKIIATERKDGVIQKTLYSTGTPILNGIPTTIIINGGSASASEIVAAALKDNGAATIVGENSFGKGSMQTLISLGDGSMVKVTSTKWYTPNGVNVTGKGIKPDQTVSYTQADVDSGSDPQMDAALAKLGL